MRYTFPVRLKHVPRLKSTRCCIKIRIQKRVWFYIPKSLVFHSPVWLYAPRPFTHFLLDFLQTQAIWKIASCLRKEDIPLCSFQNSLLRYIQTLNVKTIFTCALGNESGLLGIYSKPLQMRQEILRHRP